jgi:monoamine oxidase
MQADVLNGGKAVEQRQIVHDTRAYLAELLAKAIDKHTLDDELSKEDSARLLDFVHGFDDPNASGNCVGTSAQAYLLHPTGWQEDAVLSSHHAIERIARQVQG